MRVSLKDILIECDQMRFIFEHCPLFGQPTSTIDVSQLGFQWSKKYKKQDMTSSYELFRP